MMKWNLNQNQQSLVYKNLSLKYLCHELLVGS